MLELVDFYGVNVANAIDKDVDPKENIKFGKTTDICWDNGYGKTYLLSRYNILLSSRLNYDIDYSSSIKSTPESFYMSRTSNSKDTKKIIEPKEHVKSILSDLFNYQERKGKSYVGGIINDNENAKTFVIFIYPERGNVMQLIREYVLVDSLEAAENLINFINEQIQTYKLDVQDSFKKLKLNNNPINKNIITHETQNSSNKVSSCLFLKKDSDFYVGTSNSTVWGNQIISGIAVNVREQTVKQIIEDSVNLAINYIISDSDEGFIENIENLEKIVTSTLENNKDDIKIINNLIDSVKEQMEDKTEILKEVFTFSLSYQSLMDEYRNNETQCQNKITNFEKELEEKKSQLQPLNDEISKNKDKISKLKTTRTQLESYKNQKQKINQICSENDINTLEEYYKLIDTMEEVVKHSDNDDNLETPLKENYSKIASLNQENKNLEGDISSIKKDIEKFEIKKDNILLGKIPLLQNPNISDELKSYIVLLGNENMVVSDEEIIKAQDQVKEIIFSGSKLLIPNEESIDYSLFDSDTIESIDKKILEKHSLITIKQDLISKNLKNIANLEQKQQKLKEIMNNRSKIKEQKDLLDDLNKYKIIYQTSFSDKIFEYKSMLEPFNLEDFSDFISFENSCTNIEQKLFENNQELTYKITLINQEISKIENKIKNLNKLLNFTIPNEEELESFNNSLNIESFVNIDISEDFNVRNKVEENFANDVEEEDKLNHYLTVCQKSFGKLKKIENNLKNTKVNIITNIINIPQLENYDTSFTDENILNNLDIFDKIISSLNNISAKLEIEMEDKNRYLYEGIIKYNNDMENISNILKNNIKKEVSPFLAIRSAMGDQLELVDKYYFKYTPEFVEFENSISSHIQFYDPKEYGDYFDNLSKEKLIEAKIFLNNILNNKEKYLRSHFTQFISDFNIQAKGNPSTGNLVVLNIAMRKQNILENKVFKHILFIDESGTLGGGNAEIIIKNTKDLKIALMAPNTELFDPYCDVCNTGHKLYEIPSPTDGKPRSIIHNVVSKFKGSNNDVKISIDNSNDMSLKSLAVGD